LIISVPLFCPYPFQPGPSLQWYHRKEKKEQRTKIRTEQPESSIAGYIAANWYLGMVNFYQLLQRGGPIGAGYPEVELEVLGRPESKEARRS
jgi:hypothetical protein